jgi:tetratricopeptide (TPR) repeat protein
MRCGVRVGIAVLIAWLTAAPAARAGIYISSETILNEYRLNPIRALRSTLRSTALPARPGDSERAKYDAALASLEAKDQTGTLSDIDRADLGGLYLRFGRPRDAVRVLTAGNSGNFLVLCNLAVANHQLALQELDVNRLEEAFLTQRRALAAWPPFWDAWSHEQWYNHRRAEKLQLRLLELRYREMRLGEGKQPVFQTVDDLFPGFKTVGASGAYEAGTVTLSSLDALPPDAPWLVRELMMAYPSDARIYWLFGETLNSIGRVEDALQVLDDLVNVDQLSNIRELVAHRRVLFERASLLRDLRRTDMFRPELDEHFLRVMASGPAGQSPLTPEDLLWALAPRSAFAVPVAGPVATEAAWRASVSALDVLRRQERLGRPDPPPDLPSSPPAAASAATSALPDWRVLATGFGAGVVATVLFSLQRAEWKRRRQAALSPRQPVIGRHEISSRTR